MSPVMDGQDLSGSEHIASTVEKVTNGRFSYTNLCHSTISDRAAKGIAKQFDHDPDVCQMHDSDKIARSAAGLLTRSKNKVSTLSCWFLTACTIDMSLICSFNAFSL